MAVTANRNPVATIVRVLMALNGIEHTGVLAEPMGVSQPTVSRRMAGHGAWSVDELTGLAEFFGVPVSTFFKDPDDVREAVIDGFLRAITSGVDTDQQTIPFVLDLSADDGTHPPLEDSTSRVVHGVGSLSLQGFSAE